MDNSVEDNRKPTVIQTLIDSIKEVESRGLTLTMDGFRTMLENSLIDERHQIEVAHGIKAEYGHQIDPTIITGEVYYNRTYSTMINKNE